jgi:hypothetical protein
VVSGQWLVARKDMNERVRYYFQRFQEGNHAFID